MGTILDVIVAHKQEEVRRRQELCPLSLLRKRVQQVAPARGFAAALARQAEAGPAIIAEVKRGSPSLGCIRPDLDAAGQATLYERGGATALSVLTDERFFFGSDADFTAARTAVSLPMLRKEFIIDAYQLYESRALGADCVLLILSILPDERLQEFAALAGTLGMDVLAEVHTEEELDRTGELSKQVLIGINNRNLKTFDTSEAVTLRLAEKVADRTRLVAESGLRKAATISRLWQQDIRRFLVGEAFVSSTDPESTVRLFVQASAD